MFHVSASCMTLRFPSVFRLPELQLPMSYRLASSNDGRISWFAWSSSLSTLSQLSSRANWVTSTLGSAFTTTVRVIVRVHRGSPYVRSLTLPTISTGLSDDDALMLGIANPSNNGSTLAWHPSHFTTWQLQLSPSGLSRHKDRTHAGGTAKCCSSTWCHLDTANFCSRRNASHRHAIANDRSGIITVLDRLPSL